jgi:DNA-binding IclR family transcriptional regulator
MAFALVHADAMPKPRIADAVHRLAGAFEDDPECRLTVGEIEQLTGLEPSACHIVLDTLERAHFLRKSPDGQFIRHGSPKEQ